MLLHQLVMSSLLNPIGLQSVSLEGILPLKVGVLRLPISGPFSAHNISWLFCILIRRLLLHAWFSGFLESDEVHSCATFRCYAWEHLVEIVPKSDLWILSS